MAMPNKRSTHSSRRQRDINKIIDAMGGGDDGSALTAATYITIDNEDGLSNERRLLAGADIRLTDGGPNSSLTVGRAGERILRFNRNRDLLDEAAISFSGLSGLLAGSGAGDIIWLPACSVSINSRFALTVPEDRHIVGQSSLGSIIAGRVILEPGASLEGLKVNVIQSSASEIAAVRTDDVEDEEHAKLIGCVVHCENANGDAIGVMADRVPLDVYQCDVYAESGLGDAYGASVVWASLYMYGGVLVGSTAPVEAL